jgi:hypothetical protein
MSLCLLIIVQDQGLGFVGLYELFVGFQFFELGDHLFYFF